MVVVYLLGGDFCCLNKSLGVCTELILYCATLGVRMYYTKNTIFTLSIENAPQNGFLAEGCLFSLVIISIIKIGKYFIFVSFHPWNSNPEQSYFNILAAF